MREIAMSAPVPRSEIEDNDVAMTPISGIKKIGENRIRFVVQSPSPRVAKSSPSVGRLPKLAPPTGRRLDNTRSMVLSNLRDMTEAVKGRDMQRLSTSRALVRR